MQDLPICMIEELPICVIICQFEILIDRMELIYRIHGERALDIKNIFRTSGTYPRAAPRACL